MRTKSIKQRLDELEGRDAPKHEHINFIFNELTPDWEPIPGTLICEFPGDNGNQEGGFTVIKEGKTYYGKIAKAKPKA